MSSTKERLFTKIADSESLSAHKITIVGVGQVGMACAFAILTQNISNHVCLIDKAEEKMKGEVLDLQHGTTFIRGAKIEGSKGRAFI